MVSHPVSNNPPLTHRLGTMGAFSRSPSVKSVSFGAVDQGLKWPLLTGAKRKE